MYLPSSFFTPYNVRSLRSYLCCPTLYFAAITVAMRYSDRLCYQIKIRRKKNVKKGIQFCLMVCGVSGTGKITYFASIAAIVTE